MPIISVSGLKKYYKVYKRDSGILKTIGSLFKRNLVSVKAVNNISFSIEPGELVGFIGPNGAGKTTTLKCLSGLLYPSSGTVTVLGYTPFERNPQYLRKISLVMGQKNQLWWDLPAVDTFNLNKEIYDLSNTEYKNNLSELTNLLEVNDLIKIPTRQLSLGQRMKMELIAALIHKPKVLFLDEPTIGLDVVMQKKMREFIATYNQKYNSTILLTSHYMADVKHLCKRLIIIDRGKIIYDGSLEKLVEKFSVNKKVYVEFAQRVHAEEIEKLGTLKTFDYPKALFLIPKEKTREIINHLLNKYKIDDLTIEEPEIEDIIRLVFSKQRQ